MKWIFCLAVAAPLFSGAAVIVPAMPSPAAINHAESAPNVTIGDSVSPRTYCKSDFLEKFGNDDTSRALIRFYFFKAKGYRKFSWLPYIFAVPFSLVFIILASKDPLKTSGTRDEVDPAIIFGVLAFISLTVAIPWSIVNAVRYHRFRKRLTSDLIKYRSTGVVARRIAQSTLFRIALRGEPSAVPWIKQPKPAPKKMRR